jgi:hypothetical protein
MRAPRSLPGAGVLIGLLALPVASQGAVLTFTMGGEITQVDDSLGLLDFAGVGDRVSYTFSFDSQTPDVNPTPTLGEYHGSTADLYVEDRQFRMTTSGAPWIEVQHPLDTYEVSSHFNTALSSLSPTGFAQFVLYDGPESNALASDALPLTPLDLGTFQAHYFQIEFWPANSGYDPPTLSLIGVIDTFTPEPSCMTLLLLCAILCRRVGPKRHC